MIWNANWLDVVVNFGEIEMNIDRFNLIDEIKEIQNGTSNLNYDCFEYYSSN